MNKKFNLFFILAIFIVPLLFYFSHKPSSSDGFTKAADAVASRPTVIDFASELCLECKELDQSMKPLIPKYKNKINFEKVYVNTNTPETKKLMKEYNINVVPTLVFVNKQGKVVRKTEGSMSQQKLEGYLNNLTNGK